MTCRRCSPAGPCDARGVPERAGFRAEGVLRQRSLHRGVPVDGVIYGRSRAIRTRRAELRHGAWLLSGVSISANRFSGAPPG